jgi:hypothetical protein
MSKNFGITGLREIDQALRLLPDKMRRNIVRTGLRRAARVYIKIAKTKFRSRSGLLARSLGVRTALQAPGAVVFAGFNANRSKRKDRAWYARFVELGTQPHEIKVKSAAGLANVGGRRKVMHPGARARHPMLHAYTTGTQAAIAAARDYMRKKLKLPRAADIPDMEVD